MGAWNSRVGAYTVKSERTKDPPSHGIIEMGVGTYTEMGAFLGQRGILIK